MDTFVRTFRQGLSRGWIEFRIYMKDAQTWIWTAVVFGIFLTIIWFQRNNQVEGITLALLTLPSLLGMQIASSGFSDVSSTLSYDREDGTLLRAKAVPHGMSAYFVSRVVVITLTTLVNLTLLAVPSTFIVPGLLNSIHLGEAGIILALVLLGLLATAPFGAVIGSIVKSSASGWGLTLLPLAILVTISGIFYPITAMAGWIQVVAQIFPVYWLGLGMRSVFLPESAAALELTGSWRTLETFAVLGAWAIVGMFIAPRVLRRMARRTSGGEMQANRERVMSRGY